MQILRGHDSQDTAYLVEDYPYGFKLRCKIRYWLEHNPKRGTRLWSQTSNPKVGGWNKPKASTYSPVAGCMILNEEGHVTWSGLGYYDSTEDCKRWLGTYREGLTLAVIQKVEAWIKKKEDYDAFKKSWEEKTIESHIDNLLF